MDYLLIDQNGELHHRTAADYATALKDVGPEGWNRVQLTRDLAAFVNDVGLVLTDRYHRNVTGGLVLMALGAYRMPYAGPIVVTGWDSAATAQGRIEVVGITPLQAGMVSAVYDLVQAAMGGRLTELHQLGLTDPDALIHEVSTLGGMVSTSAAPSITLL